MTLDEHSDFLMFFKACNNNVANITFIVKPDDTICVSNKNDFSGYNKYKQYKINNRKLYLVKC